MAAIQWGDTGNVDVTGGKAVTVVGNRLFQRQFAQQVVGLFDLRNGVVFDIHVERDNFDPGIPPLDRRHVAWEEVKAANSGITEAARIGTLDNPIANANANQARAALQANPNISVFFAPYNEFAKGVKIAADELGIGGDLSIYSADISTADIALMREAGSGWKATVATNPAVVGEVSVRALALMLTGENPGASVIVPPTLITQSFLTDNDIRNMEDLGSKMPQFQHADVAMADWMPLPPR